MSTTVPAAAVLALMLGSWGAAQTNLPRERFTAIAITNNEFKTGADRVVIDIHRWSTARESADLTTTLRREGPTAMLEALRDRPSVGTIRTPDTLAYDLRFALQTPAEDGGRDIILATDRPISFWETWHQPPTVRYPFTVVQMRIDADGTGRGTLSVATKIVAMDDNTIRLENFGTSPTMLTEIKTTPLD